MASVHMPLTADVERSDDDHTSTTRIQPMEIAAIDMLPMPDAASNASASDERHDHDDTSGRTGKHCLPRLFHRFWFVWLLGLALIVVVILLTAPFALRDASPTVACLRGVTTTVTVQGRLNATEATPPDTLIAYIGDVALQQDDTHTAALYQLIASEGAEAVVLSGDFDYQNCPGAYDALLTKYLGVNFPVFAVLGNHDVPKVAEYSHQIADRLDRAGIRSCVGEVGIQTVCTYKGILVAQTTPGVFENATVADGVIAPWIERTLADHPSRWQVCSWHKNMHAMQTGDKSDDTGWGVYEACRRRGAMIATGHEHSYARTFDMEEFATQTVAHDADADSSVLHLRPNRTFAFCNGLGGRSVRPATECASEANSCPWFAHLENAGTGAQAAALFCRYHVGREDRAECYLKDVADVGTDRRRDAFTIDVSGMPR